MKNPQKVYVVRLFSHPDFIAVYDSIKGAVTCISEILKKRNVYIDIDLVTCYVEDQDLGLEDEEELVNIFDGAEEAFDINCQYEFSIQPVILNA